MESVASNNTFRAGGVCGGTGRDGFSRLNQLVLGSLSFLRPYCLFSIFLSINTEYLPAGLLG